MAETVAQLLVTLGADVSELKKGLSDAQGQLEAIRKKSDQTGLGFSKLQANVVSLNAAIGLVKDAYRVFAGATSSVISAINGAIEAASEQEDAQLQLRNALELTGQASRDVIDAYDAQSSALQQSSRFADEAVTSVQALLTRFKVLPQDMGPATQAIVDFAAATGQDIEAAAETFGRAIEGQTRGLRQFGISVEDTGSRSKNLAAVIEALEERFGGAAQASITNFRGSLIVLGNTFGEVQETVGGFFTQSEEGARVVAFISEEINRLNGFLKANQAEFQALTDTGVKTFALFIIDAAAAVLSVGSAVETVGKKIAAFAGVLTLPIKSEGFKAALQDLTGSVETESDKALQKLAEFRARFEDFGAQVPRNVGEATASLEEIPPAVENAASSLPPLQEEAKKTGDALGTVGDKFADDATPKFKEGVEKINEALAELDFEAASAGLPPLQEAIEEARVKFEEIGEEAGLSMEQVAEASEQAADRIRAKFAGDIFADYRQALQRVNLEQEIFNEITGRNATEQQRLNQEVASAEARFDAAKQKVIELREAGFSPFSTEVLAATNNLRLANRELENTQTAAAAATEDIFTVGEAFDELGTHIEDFFKIGQTRSFQIGVDIADVTAQLEELKEAADPEALREYADELRELAEATRASTSAGSPFETFLIQNANQLYATAEAAGVAARQLELLADAEENASRNVSVGVRLTGLATAERELDAFTGRSWPVILSVKATGSPEMDFSKYFPGYAEGQIDKFNAAVERKPTVLQSGLGDVAEAATSPSAVPSPEAIATSDVGIMLRRLVTRLDDGTAEDREIKRTLAVLAASLPTRLSETQGRRGF